MKEKIVKEINKIYSELRKYQKDREYFNYLTIRLFTLLDLLEVKELKKLVSYNKIQIAKPKKPITKILSGVKIEE